MSQLNSSTAQQYWRTFLEQEQAVQTVLASMQETTARAHQDTDSTKIKLLLELHQELGKLYRTALNKGLVFLAPPSQQSRKMKPIQLPDSLLRNLQNLPMTPSMNMTA